MRVLASFAVCGLAISGLAGCADKGAGATAPAGEPLASVAGKPITVEQLQKKLDEQSPFVRARYVDKDKKQEFVDGQVRFEVLAAEARARGYEKDPEVEEAIKKIIVQRLTREEFDGRVQLKDITDAELKTWFDAHQADYQKPEMGRASVIVLAFGGTGKPTKEQAKVTADKLAKEAAAKKEDRPFFKDLVEQHSSDAATRTAGGDIRYVTAAEMENRYGKEAAAWLFSSEEQNAVSPVFQTEQPGGGGAFVIVKRTGRRPAITRGFDDVKNQIKNVVYRDKRATAFNAFVEELKKKHNATIDLGKLDKLKVDPNLAKMPMDPHGAGDDGHGHGAMPTMPTPGDAHAAEGGEDEAPGAKAE